jgi:hypothetical protein
MGMLLALTRRRTGGRATHEPDASAPARAAEAAR